MMLARNSKRFVWAGVKALAVLVLLFGLLSSAQASPTVEIYQDSLASDWQDWSWGHAPDFSNSAQVKSGSSAIRVEYSSAWAGLYLRSQTAVSTNDLTTLHFWLHGGDTGGQQIAIKLVNGNDAFLEGGTITAVANTWVEHNIDLSVFGNPSAVLGVVFQEITNGTQPAFYLDEITLTDGSNNPPQPTPTATPTVPAGSGPTLAVDADANQRSISPHIYGMNFPDASLAAELELPIARWGGNATSRYNWQLDVGNRASDWFFENIADDNGNGTASDQFISTNTSNNSDTLLTIPMLGWTPKSRDRTCGFSVAKYGPQTATDPWAPDCGNGIALNGEEIVGNDPTDTSIAIDEAYVQDWVEHLIDTHGSADNGGVRFYNLDNEPMLWPHTHRDVHPGLTSYDEIRDLTYQYAAALKETDPGAQTLGPVVWGWPAYFYSAADGDWWIDAADRQAHGNVAFIPWYLQQMAAYEAANEVRILDYLDLHYYPQQANVALQPAGDANTQALRLRSTRALWDASYSDESWINEPVYLLPRMRQWVDNNYPGTKLAISEYNWGGLEHINGAVTQADILGIFGREGLDMATIWDPPAAHQPGAYAFRMFLNYDGQNGRFGETSILASSSDQSDVAIYASLRDEDSAMLIMLINKTDEAVESPLAISNFVTNGTAEQYRYSSANLNAIVREADLPFANASLDVTLPAMSMTMLVIPDTGQVAAPAQPGLDIETNAGNITLSWDLSAQQAAGTPIDQIRIYRLEDQNAPLTTVFATLDGSETSWVDTTPLTEEGLNCVYVIEAVNSGGASPISNRVGVFSYAIEE
ncbi:MAG: glycoside hydrolase family 44 protein [Chloroflexota bacterium]